MGSLGWGHDTKALWHNEALGSFCYILRRDTKAMVIARAHAYRGRCARS